MLSCGGLGFGYGFVEREEGAGEGCPGGVFLVEVGEDSDFVFGGWPGEEAAEGEGDFFFGGAFGFFEEFSVAFGDLDEHGIVHEGEGLEGGVGAVPFDETGFAGAGIEGGEHGEGRGALLVGVDAATVAIFSGARSPFRTAVGDLADAGWLGWADGWSEGFFA